MTYVSDSHNSEGQDLESGIPRQGVSRGALRSQQKSGDESGGIGLDDMGDVRGHGWGRASDSSQRPLDIDSRLTGIDRVALTIAEPGPEGESLGG